jgi:phage regulator Rha-like protein
MFDGLKMTSREIAEKTGKEHKHVLRDIDVLVSQGAILESNFGLQPYTYVGPGGGLRKANEYVLDFQATMTLILGYDAKRRAAVIVRWMELEDSQ